MATVIHGSGKDLSAPSPSERGSWPVRHAPAILVGLITILLILWLRGPLCPDVSGQFWIARAMRHGSVLYHDIVEMNPPLWFWIAIPVDALAELFGARPEPFTIAFTGAVVFAATMAVRRLVPQPDGLRRTLFVCYGVIILLVMFARNLEQREHLALIGAVPYLTLCAARRDGRSVGIGMALVIGLFGGLAFSLKPYFLAVPILTELWLVFALRRSWRPLRPEAIALAATGLAYAGAVLVFTPQYLSEALPRFASVYRTTSPPFWQAMGLLPLWWLAILAVILSQWRALFAGKAPLTTALMIGGAGFAIAWGIQHKSWIYHGLPTTGCLALALAAMLLEVGPPLGKIRLVVPAMLLWPLSFAIVDTETKIDRSNDIAPALADLREGDAFALVSKLGVTTWPATIDRGLRTSSRYGQYWMLGGLDEHRGDPAINALTLRAIRETALDYRCLPPKVVIFVHRREDLNDKTISSNPYPYFNSVPEFAAVMRHYRLWQQGTVYDAYRPVSALEPIDPRVCRNPG